MRQATIDVAKGFAILGMIQVHLMELFARQTLYDSSLGKASLFFGGPLVAPLFLTVMGYLLAKSRRSTRHLLLRGANLLVLGMLLNVGLNGHLLFKIYHGDLRLNPWNYLFGVDILFAAGLSTLILACLRKIWKTSLTPYLMLACGIVLLTPALDTELLVLSWGRYLLAFVGGEYSWGYFPLFPWLTYAIAGYLYGLLEKRMLMPGNSSAIYVAGTLCIALSVAVTSPYAVRVSTHLHAYYHHDGWFVLWTIGFLMVWMQFLRMIHHNLGQSLFVRSVKWLGRNVTMLYVLQWLIIGNLATVVFKTQSLAQLLAWYAGILMILTVTIHLATTRQGNIPWKLTKKVLPE